MRDVAQVFVEDLSAPALSDEDAHHLAAVLRLRPGEKVVACDGAGGWRACVVAARPGDGRRRAGVVLDPVGEVFVEAAPVPAVTVAFALAKGDRPEWAVQKLTEIGVDRIVPLLTERTVVRPTGAAAVERVARLRRVAREAAMQSRRRHLPTVEPLTALADVPGLAGLAGGVVFAVPGGPPPVLEPALAAIAVGPEGGWADGEVPAGAPTVGLGPNILRTETAAVVAGALLVVLRTGLVAGAG